MKKCYSDQDTKMSFVFMSIQQCLTPIHHSGFIKDSSPDFIDDDNLFEDMQGAYTLPLHFTGAGCFVTTVFHTTSNQ